MDKKVIIEGNKLLFSFLVERGVANNDQDHYYWEIAAFHKRYEWLMKCWIKFAALRFIETKHQLEHSLHKDDLGRAILYGEIEEGYRKMIKAISWYNQIKNSNG